MRSIVVPPIVVTAVVMSTVALETFLRRDASVRLEASAGFGVTAWLGALGTVMPFALAAVSPAAVLRK